MSWLNLALWFVLPLAIRKARAYFKKPSISRPPRPKTALDTFSTTLLLLLAAFQLFSALFPTSYNLLSTLALHPDSPSYVIRNHFRQYMRGNFPEWKEGASQDEITSVFGPKTGEQIIQLERLYEYLRNTENRKMYLRYGHEALTQCSWCTEPSDYALYITPSIAMSYASMLAFIGFSTLTWRKSYWRTYAPIAIGLIGAVEAYSLFLYDTSLTDRNGVARSHIDYCRRMRRWAFLVVALVVALVDKKDEWDEVDIMKDVFAKQQIIYNRAQAYRLARAATLGDSKLRKGFMEFYKEAEAVNEAISKDLQYKETRNNALQKLNLNQLITDARAMCGNIVKVAVNEGIVSGVADEENEGEAVVPEREI